MMKHKKKATDLLTGLNTQLQGANKAYREKVLTKLYKKLGKQIRESAQPQPIGFKQQPK